MFELIYEKWTANGSDIEMLYFILFLLACFFVVGFMDYRSNKKISEIMHEVEMERIRRSTPTRARSKHAK
jgi:hypothetical protein